jgi:hypothetical protein
VNKNKHLRGIMNKVKITLALCMIILLSMAVMAKQDTSPIVGFLDGKTKAQISNVIEKMSFKPSLDFAKKFGITKIHGKDITKMTGKSTGSAKTYMDVGVGTDPTRFQDEPSVAYKPTSGAQTIIGASNDFGGTSTGACAAYRSSNAGQTWTKSFLPVLFSGDICSDPIIRWAPDGSKVYATYISYNPGAGTSNIVVTKSTNNGVSWSTPVIAIPGSTTRFTDKPWADVHTFVNSSNTQNRLYVTATLFDSDGSIHIGFASSNNGGASFGTVKILADSTTGVPVLQGSRPIGGKSISSTAGDVLVCWYNSDADGFLTGSFSNRCRYSANYGSTFNSEITSFESSTYGLFEIPFFLGPNLEFHRWWGGMFPSMIITGDGAAHMVFTADPVDPNANPATSEDGDIFYFNSVPPYTTWSPPTKLNDDFSFEAQGFPTITAKLLPNGYSLVATWEDHRNSPFVVPTGYNCGSNGNALNCFYDTYSAQTNPSFSSSPNTQINDVRSLSDFIFVGDYIDSSASRANPTSNIVQVMWTDRRTKTDILDDLSNIYTDKITVNG